MEAGDNGKGDPAKVALTKTTVEMLAEHPEWIAKGEFPMATSLDLAKVNGVQPTSNGDYGREEKWTLEGGWLRGHARRTQSADPAESSLSSSLVELPQRVPSIIGENDSELARINSKYDIFEKKVNETKGALAKKYGRLQYLTKGGKNPLYYKPLSNCDVTLFADAYTKQMLTGPHMKTQLLVSR